jgi:nucleoside-diphosphate-sugar epimerase
MKLLLIGHGYLGAAIARDFRLAGWQVTAASLHGGHGLLACDVSDSQAVENCAPADFIIHCASSGRGGEDAYRRVFVDGCRNLVQAFPGTPLLFTSSSSVYSQTDGSVVDEDSPTLPQRATGGLLLEAERIVLDAGGVVARLSGLYGPGRSVILRKFLSGQAVIEEDGRRFLNQIHRDDASAAILELARSGIRGAIFNVSDDRPLSQLECYEALARMFSESLPPRAPADLQRKRGWSHKRVSNAKLRSIGWSPRYPSFLDAVESISEVSDC